MTVISSGSNELDAVMVVAPGSGTKVLKIAQQPTTRSRKPKLLDRLREAHEGDGRGQEMAEGEESWG
jgi:hypothetical protein